MMSLLSEHAITVGFCLLVLLCMVRVPVGLAMGAAGAVGFGLQAGFDPAISVLSHTVIGTLSNYSMGLIPLFILMGAVALVSGISGDLFRSARYWLGHRQGGLAMATIATCGVFSTICGSSAATAATMTRVALPEMTAEGYSSRFTAGVIAAGGTLGILIPPSIVLAVYGLLTEQSIGLLFLAGIVPGLLTMVMYFVVTRLWILVNKDDAPPVQARVALSMRLRSLKHTGPIMAIVFIIVGGLYGGVFTPTEAGAIGATSTILVVILLRKQLTWGKLLRALQDSVHTASAIMLILTGAMVFSYFLAVNDVPYLVSELLEASNLGKYGTLALIIGTMVVLGCFLDAMAVILLIVPIVYPIIIELGFDPIWFGIVVAVSAELGMITPPLGLNVFVIKNIAPELRLSTIYRGVIPYIGAQLALVLLLVALPDIPLVLLRLFS